MTWPKLLASVGQIKLKKKPRLPPMTSKEIEAKIENEDVMRPNPAYFQGKRSKNNSITTSLVLHPPLNIKVEQTNGCLV